MEGDREKCIAAGMDDYLSKPVSIDDLDAKLSTWHRNRTMRFDLPGPPETVGEVPVDLVVLRQTISGESHLLDEIIELYLSQAAELVASIDRSIESGQSAEVERMAHGLLGASLSAGMRAIIPALRTMERAAHSGQMTVARIQLTEAKLALSRIRSFLNVG